jgi:hypothetical protein
MYFQNYNQQDATFHDLFFSTDVLHFSGGSSSNHQEQKLYIQLQVLSTITAALLLSWMRWNSMEYSFALLMMGGRTA